MNKVQLEIKEDGIALLTLDYPEKRNILSLSIIKEIDEKIDVLNDSEKKIKVLIVRSKYPEFFSSGGNVKEWKDFNKLEAYEAGLIGGKVFDKIEKSEFITIASISGACLGGGNELALCCDLRISTEDAIFGQPEVLLGNGPSWGGYYRLARKLGISKAREWILLGENYSAKEAQQCGYIHKICNDWEELEKMTFQTAKRIARDFQAAKVSKLILNQIENELIPTNLMIDALSASLFVETELSNNRKKAFLDKKLQEIIQQ